MLSVQGQCFCGKIRFELDFPTRSCSHCHCEDCRRSHGAAFVTWVSVGAQQFRFLSGTPRKFESHPGVRWGFCGDCGTSFYYESDDEPHAVYLTAASLNDPLDREPARHYSFEERVPWLDVHGQLPKVRGKSDEVIG